MQPGNIFLHGVPARPDRLANRPKAGIADKTFPILTVEEVGIHSDLSREKSQRKQTIDDSYKEFCQPGIDTKINLRYNIFNGIGCEFKINIMKIALSLQED